MKRRSIIRRAITGGQIASILFAFQFFCHIPASAAELHRSAEHRVLVDRCVDRMGSESKRAECEQLQSQIDSAHDRLVFGDSVENCCQSGCSAQLGAQTCTPAGLATAGSQHSGVASGLAQSFSGGASPSSLCTQTGCLSNAKPGDPLDKIEMARRMQLDNAHTADRIADLIVPGLGRWEWEKNNVEYRLDYLNPRRCGRDQKFGICLSITM